MCLLDGHGKGAGCVLIFFLLHDFGVMAGLSAESLAGTMTIRDES